MPDPNSDKDSRLLRQLVAERRKVSDLRSMVSQLHRALARREDDLPAPDVRRPTDAEQRWVDLLWRIMPLADVAERTGIAYPTLIYWQSRGYITPVVRWVADVHPAGSEEKKWHAKYLLASGLDASTVARYMQVSPGTIYKYKDA